MNDSNQYLYAKSTTDCTKDKNTTDVRLSDASSSIIDEEVNPGSPLFGRLGQPESFTMKLEQKKEEDLVGP